MKLGMPQLYEYNSIEENLILAKELGLDFVELNLNFGYCRKEMEAKTVCSLLKKYKLEATLHFYDEADFASYDEVVDAYLSLLKRYAELGRGYIKIINVHLISGPVVTISGVKNYIYEKEFDTFSQRLVKNLKKAEQICSENDIILVIENTDNLAKYMKNAYKTLQNCGFKFNYDIGHDNVDGDYILNEVIPDAELEFLEMHVHDSDGKRCHLAIGDGTVSFEKYAEFYKNAYVVLEVKQKSDLLVSVPKFREML